MNVTKKILVVLLSTAMLICSLPISAFATVEAISTFQNSETHENSIEIGDYITLGIYLGESIVWRCVDIDENGPLMLSEKILCFKSFDAKGEHGNYYRNKEGTNNWKESCLRRWLNSSGTVDWSMRPAIPSSANVFNGYNSYSEESGFLSCFNSIELSLIKPVVLKTYINSLDENYADGGSGEYSATNGSFSSALANSDTMGNGKLYQNTTDSIFLLDYKQAGRIYTNLGGEALVAYPTSSATDNDDSQQTSSEKAYKYWMRSPGTAGMSYEIVQVIDSNQSIQGISSFSVINATNYQNAGVRPAFYLNLDNYDDGYYSNDFDPTGQIEFYSTSSVDNLKLGSEFYLDVGYYVSGALQNDVDGYILTASNDNVIITKTTNGNRGCRYLIQTIGLGSTIITATHPTTNKTSSFKLNVTANNNVYTFDNVPKIAYEEVKETNIYNYSGLVVDNFNSEYINGEYLVTMNVYNSKNLYAAVTSYYSDGTIRDYCIIDKFEGNPTSFVNNLEAVYTDFGDLYYLIKNEYYYSGKSITKETSVTINVPAGGHIEISNNVSTSEIAMLANVVGLTVDLVSVCKEFKDILPSSTASDLNGIKLTVIKNVVEKFSKEKILIDSFKDAAQQTIMSGNWNRNNTDSFLETLNDKFQRFVNEDLIKSIEDSIFSVAGVSGAAESIILDILPTGPVINALYAVNSALNHMEFNDQFSRSRSFPTGVSIYAPQNGTEQITNGIKVQMNGNENTVMHAYKVAKSTPFFEEQETKEYTYDIAMYKDGNETQPSSPVTVSIPMPSDFTRFDQVKVFRVEEDGSLTDMNAQVVAGYLVFTTNHFSEYAVIELPIEAVVAYSANGGFGMMVGDMVAIGGTFTLEDCTFEAPEGFKFKAWAIGSVNGEQKQPGEQITISAETYIHAIWEEIPQKAVETALSNSSIGSENSNEYESSDTIGKGNDVGIIDLLENIPQETIIIVGASIGIIFLVVICVIVKKKRH